MAWSRGRPARALRRTKILNRAGARGEQATPPAHTWRRRGPGDLGTDPYVRTAVRGGGMSARRRAHGARAGGWARRGGGGGGSGDPQVSKTMKYWFFWFFLQFFWFLIGFFWFFWFFQWFCLLLMEMHCFIKVLLLFQCLGWL